MKKSNELERLRELIVPVTVPGGIFEVRVKQAGYTHRWIINPGAENFIFSALITRAVGPRRSGFKWKLERGMFPHVVIGEGYGTTIKQALSMAVGASLAVAGYIGTVIERIEPMSPTKVLLRSTRREKRSKLAIESMTVQALQQALLETDQRMRELQARVNALELEQIKKP